MAIMEDGSTLEQTELANKGVLAQLAIAAVHAGIEDLPIIAQPHPDDTSSPAAQGELLGNGWVLVPAQLGNDSTGPAPGFVTSSGGKLFAFYPDASAHTLLASPQEIILGTVDVAWLAATAAAASVQMLKPGYIATSLHMQPTPAPLTPSQQISL